MYYWTLDQVRIFKILLKFFSLLIIDWGPKNCDSAALVNNKSRRRRLSTTFSRSLFFWGGGPIPYLGIDPIDPRSSFSSKESALISKNLGKLLSVFVGLTLRILCAFGQNGIYTFLRISFKYLQRTGQQEVGLRPSTCKNIRNVR